LNLFASAHGRPLDGRKVGLGEQVATVHLIADFAASEPVLRNAALEGLREIASWDSDAEASPEGYKRIARAATEALERLK
jgi:hypothetical protein